MNTALGQPSRLRTWIGGALVAVLAVTGLVAVAPPALAAGPSTVTAGEMAWGYKESFRNYVGNQTAAMPPIGALPLGERITVSGGAAFDADAEPSTPSIDETRPYLFPVNGGTVTDAQNLEVTASGQVGFHFPSHCFEMTVGDPRVVVSAGQASLYGTLKVETFPDNGPTCASYEGGVSGGTGVLVGTGTADVTLDPTELSLELTGLTVSAAAASALQGFAGAGDALDDLSLAAQLQASEPAAPSLTVSKASGLDPAGESITVTGENIRTGFANRHGGGEAGVYAQIGYLDENWRPSEGAESSTRSNAYSAWVKESAPSPSYLAWTDNGDGTADFSWTVQIDKATLDAVARSGATLAVFTIGAGGVEQAINELSETLSFAGPAATVTTVTSAPASPVAGDAVSLTATVAPVAPGTVEFFTGTASLGSVPLGTDGTATTVTTALKTGANSIRALFTPTDALHFAASEGSATVTVAPKTVLDRGSLTWGVKQSFRDYVTGPVAHGAITATGVGTAGGAFVFGQASGGTFNGTTGTSNYAGSVRFTGHDGMLDLRLANPIVRIDSATSGSLLVSVNGGAAVRFASLALAAGSRSVLSGGAVRYTSVPASLTAQGAAAFGFQGEQFYPVGTALDPVSFVIGSSSSGGAGTRTVAAFVPEPPVPSEPPATTGLTIDPVSLAGLGAGAEITATGEGFQPHESGIAVVIYSEPTVLTENLRADAGGVATWTGSLPAGLTGEHTLTFQGSVDRGIVLDIPAEIEPAALPGCQVDDATLTWGFKEAFRSYISGSIAHGEWTTDGGAGYEIPNFLWQNGEGSFDAETGEGLLGFTGSVEFTGHGGILDTTVSNPQLRFDGPDSAVLLLDVSGTTQAGEEVAEHEVEFAGLDLAGALTVSEGRVTITDAPAVLLDAGAAAFGTYEAGEEFDPVSVEFSLAPECAGPLTAPTEPADETVPAADFGWLLWLALALLALAAVAVVVTILVRRRSV